MVRFSSFIVMWEDRATSPPPAYTHTHKHTYAILTLIHFSAKTVGDCLYLFPSTHLPQILASRLGCPSFAKLPTSALVSCLRNKPVAELTVHSEVMWDDTARALVDYAWVPVRDGEIVVDVETASSFQGPLLAGLVNNEGGTMQSWEVRLCGYVNGRRMV